MTITERCRHAQALGDRPVVPAWTQCLECRTRNHSWVQLMLCLTCGMVGCCNRSPYHHAARHAREVGHPVAEVFNEPDQHWRWCFSCHATVG